MGILDFLFGKPDVPKLQTPFVGIAFTEIKGIGSATADKLARLGFAFIEELTSHGSYDNLVEALEGDHLLYFKEGAFKKIYNQSVAFMEGQE